MIEMKLKDFKSARKEFRKKKDEEQEIEKARKSKIAYKELFEGAVTFEEDPYARSSSWISARRFVDWGNLDKLPTEEIKRRVIGFLNDWHCRLEASDRLAEKIKVTYRETKPFLRTLENETLEDFEFEKKKEVDGKEYSNKEILQKVFENFCNIGYNFRGVAASKLLSLINPHLFVMWDIGICKSYGIRDPSNPYVRDGQYVVEFIPLMKEKANSAISSYMEEKKCSRKEALEAINSFRAWRPLAKLLDEYNWMK
jgi:hypothetical protein